MRRIEAALASAVFLAAAPGVVAGLVPWLLTDWDSTGPAGFVVALGAVLIALGAAVLLHAFARFVVEGRGTPAPIAPTERLVVGGLYRHVRNPMYVAVGTTIAGQALVLGRPRNDRNHTAPQPLAPHHLTKGPGSNKRQRGRAGGCS